MRQSPRPSCRCAPLRCAWINATMKCLVSRMFSDYSTFLSQSMCFDTSVVSRSSFYEPVVHRRSSMCANQRMPKYLCLALRFASHRIAACGMWDPAAPALMDISVFFRSSVSQSHVVRCPYEPSNVSQTVFFSWDGIESPDGERTWDPVAPLL